MPRKKPDPSEKPEKPARSKRAPRAASRQDVPAGNAKRPSTPKKARVVKSPALDKPLTPVRRVLNRHTLKSSVTTRSGRSWELPTRYGETKVVLLARDPYWIYAYWEITSDQMSLAKAALGDEHAGSSLVLRVYQSAGPEGGEPLFLYDVEIRPFITSWYLNVHRPDREYFVEMVQRARSGKIFLHARSNLVTTPRDFATPSPEKKWHVPETLAKYFRKETRSQQTGVSSAEVAEGMPFERFPSGQGL